MKLVELFKLSVLNQKILFLNESRIGLGSRSGLNILEWNVLIVVIGILFQ